MYNWNDSYNPVTDSDNGYYYWYEWGVLMLDRDQEQMIKAMIEFAKDAQEHMREADLLILQLRSVAYEIRKRGQDEIEATLNAVNKQADKS